MHQRCQIVDPDTNPRAFDKQGAMLPCPRCSTIAIVMPTVSPVKPAENQRRFPLSPSKYMREAIFQPDAVLYEVACSCGLSGKIATKPSKAIWTWNQAVKRIHSDGIECVSSVAARRRGAYRKKQRRDD